MDFHQAVSYFVSLLVVCSPFSALPALLGLTQGRSLKEKKRTGIVAGIAVGVILGSVTWIGSPLLTFLGISVASFQFAGGFIIFLLALSMLNAEVSRMKQTSEDQKEAQQKDSIAVVPLAIPLMAGPGAISTVIVHVSTFPGLVDQFLALLCALFVACVLGVTLYFAGHVEKVLGHTGINIVNRIGGLILAAIAIETLAKGAIGLFPVLGSH
jgi:multiple antibiotic resistance protein